MEKNMICIVCPRGCKIKAEINAEGDFSISGNNCKKGESFARAELTMPTRSLTTTVKTIFPEMPFLPVRTAGEVPKDDLVKITAFLRQFTLKNKVSCGTVIIENICGSGCDIIATCDVES
ncbi:MAG: DUF1667 domain-containing protein [Peptostreptococcaceae bacterium]|nr:DUF1667 domain-containing protein [Peptostreptococcaceae bacterium]MDY5739447.1 DUF1667 domain-containing protein [Anaerovoracaceae bacterium]